MSANIFDCSKVRVGATDRGGRGVFARAMLATGDLIELAPVIVLEEDQARVLKQQTLLGEHAFDLGGGCMGIGLGYAAIYGMSSRPNGEFTSAADGIRIVALRPIDTGEEITLNFR